MERVIIRPFDKIRELADFLAGPILARGTMTAGTGAELIVCAEIGDFEAVGVKVGHLVYDATDKKVAAILGFDGEGNLEVPAGDWDEDHTFFVRRLPIPKTDILFVAPEMDEKWYLVYQEDDGYTVVEP
jgi:hypothetical protein